MSSEAHYNLPINLFDTCRHADGYQKTFGLGDRIVQWCSCCGAIRYCDATGSWEARIAPVWRTALPGSAAYDANKGPA